MEEKFSVLLSVYRKERPEWFRESLESVFGQTVRPAEVVLVADGPLTPELDAVIAEFARREATLRVVRLPVNGGLGRALNEGLKHCSYELVARMDTDDVCKPWRFERQLAVFRQHPEVDICSAWIDEFTVDPHKVVSVHKLPETHEAIMRYAHGRNPVNHPVVMFRKRAVVAAGGYQHFPLFEDYYLWVRMLMHGSRFYNVPESLLCFRTSNAMYKRRGGLIYIRTEARFQWRLYRLGFNRFTQMLRSLGVRLFVRSVPLSIRKAIYRSLLR